MLCKNEYAIYSRKIWTRFLGDFNYRKHMEISVKKILAKEKLWKAYLSWKKLRKLIA